MDIEEFIAMLNGLIDPTTQVAYDDAETVRVFIYYEYTPEEMAENGLDDPIFTSYATFDFLNTVVTAPNAESFDYFSGETTTDFSEGLEMVDYYEEELPAFNVNLADYGFSFHHLSELDPDKYLIPLSMANLFLTGSMYDVANNGNNLYGFDTYQFYDIPDSAADSDPNNDGLYNIIKKNVDINNTIKTETVNYLAFVFDHFYGLKDYYGITDFKQYAWSYFPNLLTSTFLGNIWNFLESFEDGHTQVVSPGHHDPAYVQWKVWPKDYPTYIQDMYNEYWDCGCDIRPAEFELQIDGDTAYLIIRSFSATDFKSKLEGYMEQIRTNATPITRVIIDMTCNGGGVLANVFYLMNYMTNDNISFYTNTLGAHMRYDYAVAGDLALDADFYILTSKYTFSAANLFAALSHERGLAKTVGTQSGGGACSIQALVLPNGTLVVMSSNMNLAYSTYETVEEGVLPDIPVDWSSYASFPSLSTLITLINNAPNN